MEDGNMSETPQVHFASFGGKNTDWRSSPDEDPDDTQIETPADVVMMLGFDPAKYKEP